MASGVVGLTTSVTGSLLGFLLIGVVGRGLGVDDTGLFFQVVGWFMIVAALLRLGADTGLLRTWAVQSAEGGAGLRRTLAVALVPVGCLSVVSAVVLNLSAAPLSTHLDTADPAATAQMISILAWCLPPAVLGSVLLAGIRGLGSVATYAVLQSVALPGMRVLLVGIVVWAGLGGITSGLVAWAAPLPLVMLVGAVLVARQLSIRARAGTSEMSSVRRFWSFSVARGVAAFLETLLDWVDVLIVAAFTSPAHAGIYAAVTRLVRAGLVVDTAIRLAVAPRIATLLHADDREGASEIFTALARVVILLAWPPYLVLIVFGPTVLGWFGAGFSEGWSVLVVLSFAMMATLAAGIVQSMLLMGGRSHYQMMNKLVAVVVNVILNLLLVPTYGIAGAAAAWVCTLAVDTLLASWQVRFRMGVLLRPAKLLLPATIALAVVGVGGVAFRWALGQDTRALGVSLAMGGLAYVALLYLLRARLGFRGLAQL